MTMASPSQIENRRPSPAAEAGFSMVEVLIAMFLLVVGIFSTFTILDVSRRGTLNAQRNQVRVNKAQRDLEGVRRLDYKEVALTSSPAAISDPSDPRDRVTGSSFFLTKDKSGSSSELVVDSANGAVDPGPDPFQIGKYKGKIYRFVVWQDDPECPATTCPGTHDFKRVVVAIKLDDVGVTQGVRSYAESQSDFTNPREGTQGEIPPPDGGDQTTAQQFWLRDPTCASGTVTSPAAPSNHNSHNTLGNCSSSASSADTPAGPPDLLYPDDPDDPDPTDPNVPSIKDYSLELGASPPNPEQGLQMQKPLTTGCNTLLAQRQQMHKWATNKMPQTFQLTGRASFDFWTRTFQPTSQAGKICVYLWEVNSLNVATPIVDKTTALPYFTFSKSSWPSSNWADLNLTLDFLATTIDSGNRLMVGLSVERGGTAGDLQFMYDHPDYASRLEVETDTPLP